MNDLVPSRGRTGVGDAALFFNARRHEDGCNIFQKCENEPQQEAGFIPDGHQTAAKLPGPTSFRPRHLFAASQLRKNLPHNLPGDINYDGQVNLFDLAKMASQWLDCVPGIGDCSVE